MPRLSWKGGYTCQNPFMCSVLVHETLLSIMTWMGSSHQMSEPIAAKVRQDTEYPFQYVVYLINIQESIRQPRQLGEVPRLQQHCHAPSSSPRHCCGTIRWWHSVPSPSWSSPSIPVQPIFCHRCNSACIANSIVNAMLVEATGLDHGPCPHSQLDGASAVTKPSNSRMQTWHRYDSFCHVIV